MSDGAEQTPQQKIIEAARLAIWQYGEATGKVLPDGLAAELVTRDVATGDRWTTLSREAQTRAEGRIDVRGRL